ncbi:hypothetical protein [Pseudoduganella albidiflava]|uniref:Uncharacterized protein n=1 Tax=Pseudoduganella albidiflava TaxID=321983 RepID=A0A411WVS2_9BURK|nr:hypothetical protein [Pseudoduganella albidiflava]QBI00856.1 hypothetical protein EYF70_08355 [Pseudoduganella albidiflava]GGY30216.1 hypothetical protein GCM10007387_09810 [Pseudoduganella albidiflava]
MAYEFLVGTSRKNLDAFRCVGTLDFDELKEISRLLKKADSTFLHRVSNIFDDQTFSIAEVKVGLEELLPLLEYDLLVEERRLLHKLLAVLAYADWKQLILFGAAD